jgi:hypothetical protein
VIRVAVPPSAGIFQRSQTPLLSGEVEVRVAVGLEGDPAAVGRPGGASSSAECVVSALDLARAPGRPRRVAVARLVAREGELAAVGDQQGFCSSAGSSRDALGGAALDRADPDVAVPVEGDAAAVGREGGMAQSADRLEEGAAPSERSPDSAATAIHHIPPATKL